MVDWPSRKVAALVLVGVVIGSTVAPMLGGAVLTFLDSASGTSGTIPVDANNGPTVRYTEGGELNLTDPFRDDTTVRIYSTTGNGTFISQGDTNVTVDNLAGTWTNTSELDVATTELYINPDDKAAVNVSGDAGSLNFTDGMAIDDGAVDFVYSGTTGTTNVTVRGVQADEDIRAVDAGSGTLLAGATSDGNGVLELTGMTNSEHEVELQSSDGGPSLSDGEPEGPQNDFPTQLNVTVDDPDFDDGENVSVEFEMNGTAVGTNHTESAGKVTTDIGGIDRGEHSVNVTATDSTGNVVTLNWTFGTPNNITVRRAQPDHEVIDDRQVNATIYQGDTIINKTTTDGNISLQGVPTDGDLVMDLEAESTSSPDRSYHDSSVIIEDITKQDDVYLLDTNVTTVNITFTLDDRTGDFEGHNATVFVQKPINLSSDDSIQWHTVHADEFGAAGTTATLEKGQKYRLKVENDDDDVRVLGSYVPEQDETVPLVIGKVDPGDMSTRQDFRYNTTYTNNTDTNDVVKFEYNDTDSETDSVTVEIYEHQNESNVIFQNQTFGGPLGSFSVNQNVPTGEEGKTWVVRAVVERNGETHVIEDVVGPQRPLLTDMPNWVAAIISIGSIFVVAGLFSQLNGDVGALVVAGLGGLWWYVDMLPKETGSLVVALAMVVAGIIFINERRSQSL